jgi:hypothetical protein
LQASSSSNATDAGMNAGKARGQGVAASSVSAAAYLIVKLVSPYPRVYLR